MKAKNVVPFSAGLLTMLIVFFVYWLSLGPAYSGWVKEKGQPQLTAFTHPVKAGEVAVVSLPPKAAFLVETPKQWGVVRPWSKVVSLEIITPSGERYFVSSPRVWVKIKTPGDLVIRLTYNRKFFFPENSFLWSGYYKEGQGSFEKENFPVHLDITEVPPPKTARAKPYKNFAENNDKKSPFINKMKRLKVVSFWLKGVKTIREAF